jgi:hypothetical protein
VRDQLRYLIVNSLKETAMHNLLIALAFVVMVACPAVVAAMPQHHTEDEA